MSVISFNLFNNAVRTPEEMGKGLFQSPIAGTRICSGSAWLQTWAYTQTRWLLPRSLYGRTVPPSMDHGILICVPWKRVPLQTHSRSARWRRFNKVMHSLYFESSVGAKSPGWPWNQSDLGSQHLSASFFVCVMVGKTFCATTLPSQPTRPRFSYLLNGNHNYILDIPGCLPGFRGHRKWELWNCS